MKPLITALVDTYNQERYIEQAIVSALEQGLSASELEIIVVDDGSTDRTPSIIQKFVPRVKYLRKENGGQASAFNAGFAEARGNFVALLDGDDWWQKGKLEVVLEAFENNSRIAAVSHAYYQYFEKTGETKVHGPAEVTLVGLATPEAASDALQKWTFLQPSALTVRRELLERIGPIPEVLVLNADSVITTTAMALGAAVLPQVLSYYRLHGENLYEFESNDVAKLRRRDDMLDTMYRVLWPTLLRLGVREECAAALLEPNWLFINRQSLSTYGGSRLKTFRTEMRSFRAYYKNPTLGYKLFKYLVMGPATLLLPPRTFYRFKAWYGRHNLGRFRNWFVRTERWELKEPRGGDQE